jgi:transposase
MNILGIDIAKATFEVHLILNPEAGKKAVTFNHSFNNTSAGFVELQTWLKEKEVSNLHACMEATGIYYEALAEFLHQQQGYTVSVINPWQIKAFAQSQLRRHKNDRQDAQTIAHFCAQQSPEPWLPLSAAQKQLQALSRHLEALQSTRQQLLNRLESSRDALVNNSLQRVIDNLDQEMAQVQQEMAQAIEQDADLKEQRDLMTTIPSIGLKTATDLLAELPPISRFASAKALAAFVGLTPSEHTSGTSVRGKPQLSKIGNPRVRKILYFPALNAGRFNPIIKPWRQALLDKGKPKMVVVGAVMHKLLHIVFGVLKHRQPFDPSLAQPLATT